MTHPQNQAVANVEFGIRVSVTGEIVPYAFTSEDTGEQVGYVQLRVAGDVVSVNVDPKVAERMREGEVWTVDGMAMIRKKSAKLHIHKPESLRRVRAVANANGPTIDFGDEPTSATRKGA